MSIFLYGASGHGKVIIEILENLNITIEGLFDDNASINELLGYKCYRYSTNKIKTDSKIIISIGDNITRKMIVELLKKENIQYGNAIDRNSFVSKRTKIGLGTVVMSNAVINSDSIIGKHVIINTNASIDHDCFIEDYVHISPGVSISGNVSIGEGTHVGTGASIIPNLNIGKWCVIGAGTVIIKDIPDNSVVVGNPGKIVKKLNNEK